ncbi:MAG: hypothetical protein AAFO82_02565 [Bacteroidota bacterium]
MTQIEKLCNKLLISSGKVSTIFMLLPIVVAFLRIRYLNKALKVFLFYCIMTFIINSLDILYIYLVNNYTDQFNEWLQFTDGNLSFSMILHQVKNFLLLGWFFNLLLEDHGYKMGEWVWKSSIFLSVSVSISYIVEEGWKNYGFFGPTSEAIFLFVIPFLYLWYLYKSTLSFPVKKNPFFWISLGLATPNLIGLFLYFSGDAIREIDFCLFARFVTAKNGIDIIGQILLAIGFYYAPYAKYVTPKQ